MFPPLHQAAAALGEMYHKHPVLYNSSIVCSFQPKVIYKVTFVTSLVIWDLCLFENNISTQ